MGFLNACSPDIALSPVIQGALYHCYKELIQTTSFLNQPSCNGNLQSIHRLFSPVFHATQVNNLLNSFSLACSSAIYPRSMIAPQALSSNNAYTSVRVQLWTVSNFIPEIFEYVYKNILTSLGYVRFGLLLWGRREYLEASGPTLREDFLGKT